MTNFIDPQRATSKASGKAEHRDENTQKPTPTERAVASLQRAMGKEIKKTDNQERVIAKAIADTMPKLIEATNEETLAALFFSLERLATTANRKRIAMHPRRTEIVDEMHEEADAEDARLAEEEAKMAEAEQGGSRATEKPAGQGAAEDAMPKGAAPESAAAQ